METSDLPTERTPLIDRQTTSESLPYILELERDIYHDASYPAVDKVIERTVNASSVSPTIDLTLKLILCLRYLSGSYFALGKDEWVDSRCVEQDATDLAWRCWTELQRIAWSQAILDEILWTPFPLERDKTEETSLIEASLTIEPSLQLAIPLDDRIALSLLRVWKSGRPQPVNHQSQVASTSCSFMFRLDRIATPRVLHLMDLMFYLFYIMIFGQYLLTATHQQSETRPTFYFYCISIYAVSRIIRDQRYRWVFVISLLAFLINLPGMPRAHSFSYALLLLSFFMQMLHLMMPRSPSLPLLVPRSSAFPLSSMLQSLWYRIFIPAFLFFIPVILLLMLLLAIALEEIFFRYIEFRGFDVFLYSLYILSILFVSLIGFMTLSSSTPTPAAFHLPDVPTSWNSYGPSNALLLRHHFLHSVKMYSSRRFFFPAPLNLISLIILHFPYWTLCRLHQERIALRMRATMELALWRIAILPFVLIFGAAWAWR